MLVIVGAINNNLVDYSSKHCIVIADDVCAARYVYLICFILSQCSSSGVLKCFFLLSEGWLKIFPDKSHITVLNTSAI